MNFHDPNTETKKPLFEEYDMEQTMFRIVVKSNLTMDLAVHLCEAFDTAVEHLDELYKYKNLVKDLQHHKHLGKYKGRVARQHRHDKNVHAAC